ncbi:predicted protein [Botrytis cinerea T4]|uniref:Uncharacterized protein n=1 Tax=Botryotinia fuckeliana (strain T4) TaxID=999810 RepID=G2Y7S3_BOTF4|nr:predicted protein [Botrytis cinerea T4]
MLPSQSSPVQSSMQESEKVQEHQHQLHTYQFRLVNAAPSIQATVKMRGTTNIYHNQLHPRPRPRPIPIPMHRTNKTKQ